MTNLGPFHDFMHTNGEQLGEFGKQGCLQVYDALYLAKLMFDELGLEPTANDLVLCAGQQFARESTLAHHEEKRIHSEEQQNQNQEHLQSLRAKHAAWLEDRSSILEGEHRDFFEWATGGQVSVTLGMYFSTHPDYQTPVIKTFLAELRQQ